MAHISIARVDGRYALTVDGHDLSPSVLTEGFGIDFTGDIPVVQMRVVATELDIDLPDAVIDAVRNSGVAA